MSPARRFISLLLVVVILATFTLPVMAQQRVHVVRYGETLARIAANYGTSVSAIASTNGIVNPSLIYAGQVLIIPAATTSPGTGSIGSTGGTVRYTVQAGDNLTLIASRYGITAEQIVAINPITISTVLQAGQVLLIPSRLGNVGSQQPPVVQPPVVVYPQPVRYTGWHYVLPGQTMLQISRLYGRDVWNIARANGIYNLNRIYSGTWLRIP